MAKTKTSRADASVLADLIRSGRLAWRLMLDPRVGTIAKLAVPVLAGLYVLSPVDLIPDFIPALGQLDDLAVVALAIKLFIQLAPPGVVAEHLNAVANGAGSGQGGADNADVIDGDYRVIH